ncbi:response regulator [Tardiphaga sp. 172_B4_N1_3]|uniref:response regulator n=1 Tax=Tardiphaga sp. 172_B4_N1_3 TaxID=3240787 RepID=UPI003F8C0B32
MGRERPLTPRNVVIADRHPVVLQGLTSLLEAQDGFKVVACCSTGTSCIEAIRNLAPDIAIIDIAMPGLTGLEIITIAKSEGLSTRVVLFTAFVEDRQLALSAAAGAYGVILKDVALETLVQSLREIATGQRLLPLPSVDHFQVPASDPYFDTATCVLTLIGLSYDETREFTALNTSPPETGQAIIGREFRIIRRRPVSDDG